MIAHVPPSLFTFPLFLFKKKSRLITLVADLQSIHVGEGSGVIRKLIFSLIGWVERLTFNASDHLVFMSDAMLDTVGRENLDRRIGVDVCYPGVTIGKRETDTGDSLQFIESSNTNIVYSGALGEKQNPEFLYRLFAEAASLDRTLHFYVLSEGDLFERIKSMGAGKGSRITFLPLVSEDDLVELYAKSNVQVVPQKPGTSDGSLPSKVPNLMSNHVPIFAITDKDGDLSNLLDQYPLGCHTQSPDVSIAAEELVKFVQSVRARSQLDEDEKNEAQLSSKFSFDKFSTLYVENRQLVYVERKKLKPAVFLDRDGVINIDFGHVGDPSRIVYVEGSLQSIKLFNDLGFQFLLLLIKLVLVKASILRTTTACMERIQSDSYIGAFYDDVRFCPYHSQAVIKKYAVNNHF